MMHTQIHNLCCKYMSGFIILDVTPICYNKAPQKRTSHDAHLANNSEMKEITSITTVKEYSTDNTFEWYITIVVVHFSSITKRQSTKQEQLPKVERKYSWPLKLLTIP
jgi:hypothetical protein